MHRPRLRGACLQCARKKRKCDHKVPQCTQCVKHGQTCEPQTFKVTTPGRFGPRRSSFVQNAQLRNEAPAQPVVPPTDVQDGLIPAQVQDTLPASPPLFRTTLSAVLAETESVVATQAAQSDAHHRRPSGSDAPVITLGSEPSIDGSNGLSPVASTTGGVFPDASLPLFPDFTTTQDTILEAPSLLGDLPQNLDDVVFESTDGQITPFTTGLGLTSLLGSTNPVTNFEPFPSFMLDRLYCPMPWPDDMLRSPERRFLWQYFLSIAEADFLCLDWEDVGHFYGFQHPYITTMPHMALSNEALRGAVFCFAASQYQLRHGRLAFERTKRQTGQEAALSLSNQSIRGADDNDLLSLVSAATLLHYFGPQHNDYLRVASHLVSLFLTRSRSRPDALTSFPEVPLTEFRWSVISTLCSLQRPSTPLGDEMCRLIEMSEEEIRQKYSAAFRRWVSHPIYTFSPRLVNPLLRIGRLLERQLQQLDGDAADETTDLGWAARVAEAEEMLLAAREQDVRASRSALGSADPAAVLALNESMYAAGAILLYARIHGLPPTAPFIRRQARIVVDEIIVKIPAASRVSFAIVFPLFIAGCEAVEQQMRDSIVEKLREPKGITYDRGDLVGALRHIWEIRDLDPGLPWPHWVNKVEPRYRISCLM